MLTLKQTPSTIDTDIIFVWQILSEGEDIISNGGFASGTDWTAGGSWSIGSGVATLDNTSFSGSSALSQTIATTNATYLLEYEVTANTLAGNTISFLLASGGSYFIDDNINLETTVGTHQLQLTANGGTVLEFRIVQSIVGTGAFSIDNISLRLAEDRINLCNEIGGITLSSIFYDGAVRASDIPTEFSEGIDITSGGGIGYVNSMSFGIARYNTNTKTSAYFNEFYPNTGRYLTSRRVRTGFCWVGATTEAEITWLPDTYIEETDYTPSLMTLFCVAYRDLELIPLPFYEVQKSIDNGVSYFPQAPAGNIGRPLPILYGDFSIHAFEYQKSRLATAICVHKPRLWYLYASHKIKEDVSGSGTFTGQEIFKFINGVDNYLILQPESGELFNTQAGALDLLYGTGRTLGDTVFGKIYIVPKGIGETSNYEDIGNIIDQEFLSSTYLTVEDASQVSLKVDGNLSQSDLGLLGYASTDISLEVSWQSDNGGNRQITLAYYNPSASGGGAHSIATQTDTTTDTGGTWDFTRFNFGNVITAKSDTTLPWSLAEVLNLDWKIVNTSGTGATSGDINIRTAYIILSSIIVSQLSPDTTKIREWNNYRLPR